MPDVFNKSVCIRGSIPTYLCEILCVSVTLWQKAPRMLTLNPEVLTKE